MSYATLTAGLTARNLVLDAASADPIVKSQRFDFDALSLAEMRGFVVRNCAIESQLTQAVVAYSIATEAHNQDEFPGTPAALDLDLRLAYGV